MRRAHREIYGWSPSLFRPGLRREPVFRGSLCGPRWSALRRRPYRLRRQAASLMAALGSAGTAWVFAETVTPAALAELPRSLLDASRPAVGGVRFTRADLATAPGPRAPGGSGDAAAIQAGRCVELAREFAARLALPADWRTCVPLHEGVLRDPARAVSLFQDLRRRIPRLIVQVSYSPDAPLHLVTARRLAAAGAAVEITGPCSARQVVAVTLLARPSHVTVDLGIVNRGTGADLLGEEVVLSSQRALRELRAAHGLETLLVVRGIESWQHLLRVAGCDVPSAPCPVLATFLGGTAVNEDEVRSRRAVPFREGLGIPARLLREVGHRGIDRLLAVDPDFSRTLAVLARRADLDGDADGILMRRCLEEAGAGDLLGGTAGASVLLAERDRAAGRPFGTALDVLLALEAAARREAAQRRLDQALLQAPS